MNRRRILERARNNPNDVRFSDLLTLVEAFGYTLARITGSHRIFEHPDAPTVLNLQPGKSGKAKPYQVRQFLKEIEQHGLLMEADR
jgi:predicted RNA binding protein YcfA (HicA-like mRNA interferase family)